MCLKSLLLFLFFIVFFTEPLEAGNPTRRYYDRLTLLQDSTVMISFPDAPISTQALEVRAALPDAENYSPLQAFSVLWNVASKATDYYRATLRPCNPMPDEVFDHRFVTLEVVHHSNGADSLIHSQKLKNGFAMDAGENTLCVEVDPTKGEATIFGGVKNLQELVSVGVCAPFSGTMAIEAEGKARISLAVSEYTLVPGSELVTPWTEEELQKTLETRSAPEGIYRYLDRNTDPTVSRLGGNYCVALVAAPGGGYDIIYISGATINSSAWHAGMLKGRLKPTVFQNHYDLVWYDSLCEPISNECYADISQNAILELQFPTLKASMRLALQRPDN